MDKWIMYDAIENDVIWCPSKEVAMEALKDLCDECINEEELLDELEHSFVAEIKCVPNLETQEIEEV